MPGGSEEWVPYRAQCSSGIKIGGFLLQMDVQGFSNDFSLVMSVVYQLIKIYGLKRPGYRLLMNSSGCAIAQ